MHTVAGDVTHDLGRKLVGLQKTLRLSDEETRLHSNLSGHVVELSLGVAITIAPLGRIGGNVPARALEPDAGAVASFLT